MCTFKHGNFTGWGRERLLKKALENWGVLTDSWTCLCSIPQEQQRMALLTLALEQGKVRFITACVRSWADGGRLLCVCVCVCVWLLCPV